jgi:hypothetical protein
VLTAHAAATQSVTNMNALQGLVPVTTLGNTDAGRAALASNLTVSRGGLRITNLRGTR